MRERESDPLLARSSAGEGGGRKRKREREREKETDIETDPPLALTIMCSILPCAETTNFLHESMPSASHLPTYPSPMIFQRGVGGDRDGGRKGLVPCFYEMYQDTDRRGH